MVGRLGRQFVESRKMSRRFRATLPPSYHFKNSLQDEQPYFHASLDDHIKISHTSHVPSFLALINLSKDRSCAREFSGRNCSHGHP